MYFNSFDTTTRINTEDNQVRLEADVPGVSPENIKVEIVDCFVSIRGGDHSAAFKVGNHFDLDQAKVAYNYGVVTVTIPKKAKRILTLSPAAVPGTDSRPSIPTTTGT